MTRNLPAGTILEVLDRAGIHLRRGLGADRIRTRCVLSGHEDRHPSAVVYPETNCYLCACCGSFGARELARRLSVPWPLPPRVAHHSLPTSVPKGAALVPSGPPYWSRDAARALWDASLARARDDNFVEADRAVWRYLASRELALASDLGLVGVLPPEANPRWHQDGYRLLAPLYDVRTGEISNVQARRIVPGEPKTLFPRGSVARGVAFACPTGRALLTGEVVDPMRPVVFGEGLTDSLALAISYGGPSLCAPGVGNSASAIGLWSNGRVVLIALDLDPAGEARVAETARAIHTHGGQPVRLRWPAGAKDACEVLERFGAVGLGDFLDAAADKAARLGQEVRR